MDGRLRGLASSAGLLLLIAGVAFMQSPVSAATLPKPTHTNKTRFRIPYKFDSTSLQRMNAREIQLHVSRDHGATWELAQTLTPDGGKFEYQAPSEGEYWFSVKTLDGRNQVHPPKGSYETGLIVVVDHTSPTLSVSLQQIADGKVQLTWKATDANLDVKTLRLEFIEPGSTDWEAISIVPHQSGETSWPVSQSGVISVRGSVSDLAGNLGQVQEQITATATPGGRALNIRRRGPIADKTTDGSNEAGLTQSMSAASSTVPAPEENDDQGPVITPMGRLPQYSQVREKPHRERWPTASTTATTTVEGAPFSTASVDSTQGILVSRNSVVLPSQSFEPMPAQRTPVERRAVSRQRMVATRKFQLGYAVGEVGPSGVSEVELFITEDNGRKWWKYGDDPDHKSPFDVEVPRDGIYGFTIRARSGAGLTIGPPAPNEPPETIIAVDQTPPIVELLPIEQGKGASINRLRVRWKITEDHPSDMPVSLEYAANLNGPWTPISGWREDVNHTFDWTVGPGVPTQFHIRVLARDSAGNVGKAESQIPILVDLVQPTARIVDVEVAPGIAPQ